MKTQGNSRAISTFCFSTGHTAVYGWQERMIIPVSGALIADLVYGWQERMIIPVSGALIADLVFRPW